MRFGGLTAVQGVDIHLAAGEVLGIIGPNGAGKSTLLNLLTGIYQPTEGEVLLQGRSLKGMAAHDIAGAGIARTFQTSRLFGSLSVLDNVIAGVKNGATDAGAMQQALGRGLNELDAGMSRVQAMRSFAGDQLNRADRLEDDMKNQADQQEAARSRAEDIDMIKALSDVDMQKVGMQAALQSYASIQKLSLFNFIN